MVPCSLKVQSTVVSANSGIWSVLPGRLWRAIVIATLSHTRIPASRHVKSTMNGRRTRCRWADIAWYRSACPVTFRVKHFSAQVFQLLGVWTS